MVNISMLSLSSKLQIFAIVATLCKVSAGNARASDVTISKSQPLGDGENNLIHLIIYLSAQVNITFYYNRTYI